MNEAAWASGATIQPPPPEGSAEWPIAGGWLWLVIGGAAAVVFAGTPWRKLGRGPIRPWRFRPITGITTFLLALLSGMIVSVAAAKWQAINLADASIVDLLPVMLMAWAAQLSVVACLPLIRNWIELSDMGTDRRMPRRGAVCPDRRPSRLYAACVGVIGLLLFWPMTHAVARIGAMAHEWFTGEAPSQIAHGTLQQLIDAPPDAGAWAAAISIAILPSVVEEVLYRGLLQESLRRARLLHRGTHWHAVILTSLIFTAMHVGAVDNHALMALFVLSLGFGWAYARTGRLTASITMHVGFNAGNIVLAVPWI